MGWTPDGRGGNGSGGGGGDGGGIGGGGGRRRLCNGLFLPTFHTRTNARARIDAYRYEMTCARTRVSRGRRAPHIDADRSGVCAHCCWAVCVVATRRACDRAI